MKIEQRKWTAKEGWKLFSAKEIEAEPQLVMAFTSSKIASDDKTFNNLKSSYPNSHLLICSTAGEIIGDEVDDDSMAVTAINFEKTKFELGSVDIKEATESESAGEALAKTIPADSLVHVMIFSDGLKVNGTALVRGLTKNLPENVSITGGLVGDGSDFKHTYVGLDEPAKEGKIAIVGFYGQNLKIGYGSLGGWDPFGPERTITKSENNVLYELDGKPALSLYKEYLGDQAAGLPSSGLLFPLSLRIKDEAGKETEVVRTLLAVDETQQSMTFAGDMPKGAYAKLMKANFDRLIDGASGAANMSIEALTSTPAELAILISCVGRKLVLKERVEEEVEAVHKVVGQAASITGFYSYGELCPTAATEKQCQLHNQTMTITTFRET